MFSNVPPRYLNPKGPKGKPSMPAEREKVPQNPAFRATRARYLDPVESSAKPTVVPPSPFHDALAHKKFAKATGFGNTQSRYAEAANNHNDGIPSPREIVEHRKVVHKAEKGWKSPGRQMPANFTFDQVRKLTDNRLGEVKKKKLGTSMIKEYLKSGAPIRHHSQRHPPPRRKGEDDDAEGLQQPQWHSGGVQSTSFGDLHKKSLAARPQYAEAEEKAKEQAQRLALAKRPRNSVPRVARLAPAYQLPPELASPQPSRSRARDSTGSQQPEEASPEPLNDEEEGDEQEEEGLEDDTYETEATATGNSPHQQQSPSPEPTSDDHSNGGRPSASKEIRWTLKGNMTL